MIDIKWLKGGQGYVRLPILVHFHEANNLRPYCSE